MSLEIVPQLTSKTITVKAGARNNVALGSATILLCTAATAPFKLAVGGGPEIDFAAGFMVDTRRAGEFNRVQFVNTSGADITISFYAGNELISYFPAINTVVFVKNPGTFTQGLGQTTLNAGASMAIPATSGTSIRKAALIASLDAVQGLQIYDGDPAAGGVLIGFCQPSQSWGLETSGTLYIKNPGAGVINIACGCTFYT